MDAVWTGEIMKLECLKTAQGATANSVCTHEAEKDFFLSQELGVVCVFWELDIRGIHLGRRRSTERKHEGGEDTRPEFNVCPLTQPCGLQWAMAFSKLVFPHRQERDSTQDNRSDWHRGGWWSYFAHLTDLNPLVLFVSEVVTWDQLQLRKTVQGRSRRIRSDSKQVN